MKIKLKKIMSIMLSVLMLTIIQVPLTPMAVLAGDDQYFTAPDPTRNGIRADYFSRKNNSTAETSITHDDYMTSNIDSAINWPDLRGLLKDRAGSYEFTSTIRTGWIKTPAGGSEATYQFSFVSDEGIRLWIDGRQIHSRWLTTSYDYPNSSYVFTYRDCTNTIDLKPDTYYKIRIEHFEQITQNNQGIRGSCQILRWARTGDSPFSATIIPPEAYFLDAAYKPARITEIDSSEIGAVNPPTLYMDVENFTSNTILKVFKSADSRQVHPIVVPYTSLGDGKIKATLPANMDPAMYRFLVESPDSSGARDVIKFPSQFFFTTFIDNAPRPEYPSPEYARDDAWESLNGEWDFKIDKAASSVGVTRGYENGIPNPDTILVPFPWQSPASGIFDETHPAQGGWYYRTITPASAKYAGKEIYIKFGAVDAESTLWVNGQRVGYTKNGGYTPFEYNITSFLKLDEVNSIALYVYDNSSYGVNAYTTLVGKQGRNAPCGYVATSGIWQSVILEGRISNTQLEYLHVDPLVNNGAAVVDADKRDITHGVVPVDGTARFKIKVNGGAGKTLDLAYNFEAKIWDDDVALDYIPSKGTSKVAGTKQLVIPAGEDPYYADFIVDVPNQQLWRPNEPNLYVGSVQLKDGSAVLDTIDMYFGQRDIHNAYWETSPDPTLPNQSTVQAYQYVLLNNRPILFKALLDQGFWEEGIHTAPTEEILKYDVKAMRDLGFNMMRKHLKIEDPLQYVWFDRLGMMLSQDMPHSTNMSALNGAENSGRDLYEQAFKELIYRDYNKPSRIQYSLFNENWGISTNQSFATWSHSLYALGHTLDTSGRLVEDMSPSDANNSHLQPTDLNSFHFYEDGYANSLNKVSGRVNGAYIGSTNSFNGWSANNGGGNTQDGDPLLNSEYGGVGFPDGDYEISWTFKFQTDIQRRYQKLQGFLYTEPYDIEMERNGLLMYDRSKKIMGYDEIAYGGDMSVNWLVKDEYVGFDNTPITTVAPGGVYSCGINYINWAWKDANVGPFTLKWRVDGTDVFGNKIDTSNIAGFRGQVDDIDFSSYITRTVPLSFTVPNLPYFNRFAGVITAWIEDGNGETIAKNFNLFKCSTGTTGLTEQLGGNSYVLRQTAAASSFASSTNGSQRPGTKTGYISYEYNVPSGFNVDELSSLRLVAEIAAERKISTSNRTTHRAQSAEGYETPSDITVTINGHPVKTVYVPDSPLNMQGIMTLNATQDSAGKPTTNTQEGFGYLLNLDIDKALIETLKNELKNNSVLTVRYEVLDTAKNKNGVRLYTDTAGRFPVSPSVMLNPPELYHKEGAISDGSLQFKEPLPGANYTLEASVTGSQATINAGYGVSINGDSVTISGNKTNKTYVSDSTVEKIRVTFFDEQVRVYVNENPDSVIDVYGDAQALTNVSVSGALADVKVLPETYRQVFTLSSTVAGSKVQAGFSNSGTEDAPVVLVAAVYDSAGKLALVETDDTLVAKSNDTVSKTFNFDVSGYPGFKIVVYAWKPGTYVPLVPGSIAN